MKKYVLLLVMVLSAGSLTAQQTIVEQVPVTSLITKVTRDRGLQYTIEGDYHNSLSPISFEDDDQNYSATGGNFVLSYKMNPNFSLGIGGGFYHLGGHIGGYRWDMLMRGMYRITKAKVSPFLSVDAGLRNLSYSSGELPYNIDYSYLDESKSSFFVSPAIGMSFRVSTNSYFDLKVGYDYTPDFKEQDFEMSFWGSRETRHIHYDGIGLSSLYVGIGYTHTLNLMPKRKHNKYRYNYAALSQTTQSRTTEELFDEAKNIPNEEAQRKYNAYMQVARADANNQAGYLAPVYNNIGVLFYNQGDVKKAKNYFETALAIAPDFLEATENLKVANSIQKGKQWDMVSNVLGALGSALGTATGMPANGILSVTSQLSADKESLADNQKLYDLGGGNYDIHTWNDDGSLDVKSVRVCFACQGRKICGSCNGAKGRYNAYTGLSYPCSLCLQTGICQQCKGQGAITTYSHTDANGNTSLHNTSGYTANGSASGVSVTDPNGRTTASGGGSSTQSSSRSGTSNGTCSKCNGRKYDSDRVSYAPASHSGWNAPYHNTSGTKCYICGYATDHYHTPCSNCRGYGHEPK